MILFKNISVCISKKVSAILCLLISTLMLCFLAIYNGYPLVFNNDSGMYIENAFDNWVAPDRPKLYGLFILVSSLARSLWLVVFVQALIVSLVLWYYFKYFATGKFHLTYLLFMATISFGTSASFEVSWIMPDVFTSVSILSLGLLLFAGNITKRDAVINSLLVVLSISVHNSHFYICLLLVMIVYALFFVPVVRTLYYKLGLKHSKGLYCFFLILFSYFFMGAVHYLNDGHFKTTRGGSVFILSNFIEMGVVDIYLDDNCDQHSYKLCKYKDSLPNNFLWDYNSPIKKTGGWEVNRVEYSAIIKEIISTPPYLKMVIYQSTIYTFKQFFNFDFVDIWKPSERINSAIRLHFPQEYPLHMSTKETNFKLHVALMHYLQSLIIGVILSCYVLIFLFTKIRSTDNLILFYILMGMLINAWICGTFSGVFPRYQARVVWMLPLPLFLIISRLNIYASIAQSLSLQRSKTG